MNKILVNTHGYDHCKPEQHGEWIDLATADEVTIKKGEYALISLGVSMKLPEGYYAEIVPRSSTCKKWGVIQANSMGIIENTFCGRNDIYQFPAVAIRDTTIPEGTRVCQFRIVKQQEPFEISYEPWDDNISRGGLGSTGD